MQNINKYIPDACAKVAVKAPARGAIAGLNHAQTHDSRNMKSFIKLQTSTASS